MEKKVIEKTLKEKINNCKLEQRALIKAINFCFDDRLKYDSLYKKYKNSVNLENQYKIKINLETLKLNGK